MIILYNNINDQYNEGISVLKPYLFPSHNVDLGDDKSRVYFMDLVEKRQTYFGD